LATSEDMNPAFSVIIPAHNEENYIRKTLRSLQQQTYQNFEVIVVANGCTDKTEEIVKKRADERLRILSLPKANVSVARNAGALNANGKLLLFLDADTQLAEDALQTIKEQFADHHAIATTKVLPEPPQLKYKLLMGLKNAYNQTKLFKGFSGTVICRKQDFHEVNGYNPELIVREHHDLRKKLEQKGKYACIPTYATTSMRRFEQWSIPKAASFWIKQWGKQYLGKDLSTTEYEKIR